MIDALRVMQELSRERQVFRSEYDLQDAFASKAQEIYSTAVVHREVGMSIGGRRALVDLRVDCGAGKTYVELKYKTTKCAYPHPSGPMVLKSQSAQDQGRYDVLKDFSRLESIVESNPSSRGTFVFLTNDRSYWTAGRKIDSQDGEFKLTDGRTVTGTLSWAAWSGPGSTAGREASITLKRSYHLKWRDYAAFSDPQCLPLRMLLVDF